MGLSSLHIHTELCDGAGSVDDFCKAALAAGMESLGFSAHTPVHRKTGIDSDWHLKDKRLGEYLRAVEDAKRRYAGQLAVYAGLEVDYIRGYISPRDADIQALRGKELDYLIGSVHCVLPEGKKVNWARGFLDRDKLLCVDGNKADLRILIERGWADDADALVRSYFQSEIEMCTAGGFDILAHCDLVKKNNQGDEFFSTKSASYMSCAQELALALSKSDIVAEVNTGGINRGRILETYPSVEILKIFYGRGIPVTVNSDAHRTSDVAGNYERAFDALRSAGYKEYFVFKGRERGTAHWEARPVE